MNVTAEDLTRHLLDRLRQVQRALGFDGAGDAAADTVFGDALDSMAMVEFLALLAEDCGTKPQAIEECVARRLTTVKALAEALRTAGIVPRKAEAPANPAAGTARAIETSRASTIYLAATVLRLPDTVQPATEIDAALGHPDGWFESHAGICSRRLWAEEDPLTAAVDAGRACLEKAGLLGEEVGALLVTSEAPPLLAGLAAAMHHRLGLPARAIALEIGGACTGFLAALWTAQRLVSTVGTVLAIALEVPSRYLRVGPGPAGEAAALFGEGAAACVLCGQPAGSHALPLREVRLGADGSAGSLIQLAHTTSGTVEVHMDGSALAGRAIETMAEAVRSLTHHHGLGVADLRTLVAHGGNGRMPGLLARRLGLSAERVWSTTPQTGNLGSASLPAAWAQHGPTHDRHEAGRSQGSQGPAVWVGVGAGLTWGAALLG